MEYKFQYGVKPENLLFLALVNIYNSITGLVNCVFTVSMFLLIFRFWVEGNLIIRILLISGALLFPVLQPLSIYFRSIKIVKSMPRNIEMTITDRGINIKNGNIHRLVNYQEMAYVKKIRNMIIIIEKNNKGFVLNKETLNGFKEEIYSILKEKIS